MSTQCSQEFICLWKIRNYSLCFQKNGEKLESSAFRVDCIGGSEWSVEVYPRGFDKDSEGNVSLFLRQIIPSVHHEESSIRYTLSIGTNKNFFTTNTFETLKFRKNFSWGRPKFVSIEKVMDELKNSAEDIITIRCQIFSKCGLDRCPMYETYTHIGKDFTSFLWNVNIADATADCVRKFFTVNSQLNYEMSFSVANDSVKICITQVGSDLPTLIVCKLSLLNSKGKELCSKNAQHLFESTNKNEVWEFPSFISKTEFESGNVLKENNIISLLCEVASSNGNISTNSLASKCDLTSDVDGDESVLLKELKCMLLSNVHSDVILKVDDEEVHAHKSVLSARSPIFSAMFEQDMIESQTGIIHIVDVEADTLKQFLEFIYTATVDKMDYEKAKKLLFTADKYQVVSLKEKCASYLESVISLRNVCDILHIVDMVDHRRLKHSAINFVIENSAKIFNTPEWLGFIEKNSKLAKDIFSNIAVNFKVSPKTIAPLL